MRVICGLKIHHSLGKLCVFHFQQRSETKLSDTFLIFQVLHDNLVKFYNRASDKKTILVLFWKKEQYVTLHSSVTLLIFQCAL